jgi:hypothetical protein
MGKDALLRQIMVLCFAAKEWELFLDIHPHHKQGLDTHAKLSKDIEKLTKEFTEKFGALEAEKVQNTSTWEWVTGDIAWPWDAQ